MILKQSIDWKNEWFPIDDVTYLNFAAHAAIPRVALNALQLSVAAKMRPHIVGDLILVHAAAGGTGLILCQWAAALGATVIGTVSTDAKAEMAHAHGCNHTILYTKQDFVAEVSRISGGEKLPVVFDSVGKDTFLRSLDCLRPRGLMVTFGQASGPIDPIAPVLLSQKGSLFLTRPFLFHYIERRDALEASANELFEVLASGRVRINVNQRFALKYAADAEDPLRMCRSCSLRSAGWTSRSGIL